MEEKIKYDVYLMDMYMDECGWQENDRQKIGSTEIMTDKDGNIGEKEILEAMKDFTYSFPYTRTVHAIDTTDRRKVYVEDYYGDGSWFEVGAVKGRMPVYGLQALDGRL